MKKKHIVFGVLIFILVCQLASVNINNRTFLVDKDEDIEWLNFGEEQVRLNNGPNKCV